MLAHICPCLTSLDSRVDEFSPEKRLDGPLSMSKDWDVNKMASPMLTKLKLSTLSALWCESDEWHFDQTFPVDSTNFDQTLCLPTISAKHRHTMWSLLSLTLVQLLQTF